MELTHCSQVEELGSILIISFLTDLLIDLMDRWMRIKFCCDVGGQVMVKTIAKTFAAGKTEKLVSQALAEVELPSEKVFLLAPIIIHSLKSIHVFFF